MPKARIFLGLLLFIFPVFVFAQNADETAKEKLRQQSVLLEELLADAKNLRLPENKAFIYAKIGSALWRTDEKRARQLFQDSIAELITAQGEADADKNRRQYLQGLIYGQHPRWIILFLISNRDAEFALEAMVKTRPAKIAQSVINYSDDYSQTQQYARSELQNEQRLLAIAAEQSPERAIKLVRENLKKGVSYETLNLLRKIHTKNAQAADSLAEEVGQKFLEMDFAAGYQSLDLLSQFLYEFGREKTADEKALKIPDQMIQNLVSKMIDYWLKPETKASNGYSSIASLVEKLFPARAAQVKAKFEQFSSQILTEQQQAYTKLLQSDASAEELVRQAENLPRGWRNEVYRRAAEKAAQSGNIAQAESIVAENFSEDESDYYVSQFYYNLSVQAASKGNFDEAASFARRIPNLSYRINALTHAASTLYQRNPKENQKAALAILDQAREFVSDVPESYDEITVLLSLAGAYAPIEPARAFSLIESLIPTLNELNQANSVLAKFRNNGNFRQGEFQVGNGQVAMEAYGLENVLQALKNSDFGRAVKFADSFSRLDTRISLKLHLIDENISLQITNLNALPLGTRFSIN